MKVVSLVPFSTRTTPRWSTTNTRLSPRGDARSTAWPAPLSAATRRSLKVGAAEAAPGRVRSSVMAPITNLILIAGG